MKKFKIGVQLYSVRDDMEKDMEKTLKEIAEMGYDSVEFAGYFDHTAEEVKAILDKYGLEAISVHQTYEPFLEDGENMVKYLKTIGAKYSAIPWLGLDYHRGGKLYAYDTIIKVAKFLKENGITMLYHNHDFEFTRVDGKFILDWLYETIPEDLIKTEIDTCWVRYAGYDPAEYLLKYSGRAPLVHLKDFVCTKKPVAPVYDLIDGKGNVSKMENRANDRDESGFMFKPLGMGCQDFPAIIEAAEKAGSEYLIVEMDSSPEMPALEAVRKSREYLKSLGL
ncbi:MAG: sugar phosphate isomerase/epimerase [Clostridia bacterium]|nr:sugar phosphate isomerase/epimerase [Clostridia bacterium]